MKLVSAELIFPVTRAPLKNAAVAIDEGKIVSLGPRNEFKKKYPGAKELHHKLLIPGLINAHTHFELSSIPPIPSPKDFVSWLIKIVEFKRELDPIKIERAAKQEISDSLRLGITSVGDIASEPVLLEVHKQSRLFSTVFFELIGIREENVSSKIDSAKSILGEFNYQAGNSRLGLSPHTPYTAGKELYRLARELAAERDLGLCTHLAESREEVDFIMSGQGPIAERLYPFVGWLDLKPKPNYLSPAQYLKDFIDENITLAHCTEVSDDDLEIVARARAVVHCPRSNLNLTGKLAPVPKMLKSGVPVALGTDSPASAGDSNLWSEMQKVFELREKYPGGEIKPFDIFKMATINSARAIFRENELGAIEQGKIANLIALNPPELPITPDHLSTLIIDSGPESIDVVYLAGGKI